MPARRTLLVILNAMLKDARHGGDPQSDFGLPKSSERGLLNSKFNWYIVYCAP